MEIDLKKQVFREYFPLLVELFDNFKRFVLFVCLFVCCFLFLFFFCFCFCFCFS